MGTKPQNPPFWSKESTFISNYATLGAVISMTVIATLCYVGITWQLRDINRRIRGVVYGDDMDRFSTQIQLLNPDLKLVMPKSEDVMRRPYNAAVQTKDDEIPKSAQAALSIDK